MFIPTNSDSQKLGNLRKKTNRENKNNFLSTLTLSVLSEQPFDVYVFGVFFFQVGPICPFLFLLCPFKPRNKLFYPGFNFIYPK